jgi:hypothetical protein
MYCNYAAAAKALLGLPQAVDSGHLCAPRHAADDEGEEEEEEAGTASRRGGGDMDDIGDVGGGGRLLNLVLGLSQAAALEDEEEQPAGGCGLPPLTQLTQQEGAVPMRANAPTDGPNEELRMVMDEEGNELAPDCNGEGRGG